MPVVEAKRVAVLGAAGGIGQPLSLLLKMNKCVTELALFDVAPLVKGVAADLSHCNTPVQVSAATWLELAAAAVDSSFVDQGSPDSQGLQAQTAYVAKEQGSRSITLLQMNGAAQQCSRGLGVYAALV
jgi:hypothetical protein